MPPKRFDWRKSLKDARTALEDGDTEARAKLVKALDDAAQMAELCHDKLFDLREPRPSRATGAHGHTMPIFISRLLIC